MMMRKCVYLLMVTAVALFTFTACSSPEAGPEKAVKGFLGAVQDFDFVKAADFATEDSKSLLLMLASMTEEMTDEEKEENKMGSYSIQNTTITEDSALVQVLFQGEDSPQSFTVKKVDGSWKVEVKKETLNKE